LAGKPVQPVLGLEDPPGRCPGASLGGSFIGRPSREEDRLVPWEGIQPLIHATGDRAIPKVLDFLEMAGGKDLSSSGFAGVPSVSRLL